MMANGITPRCYTLIVKAIVISSLETVVCPAGRLPRLVDSGDVNGQDKGAHIPNTSDTCDINGCLQRAERHNF
jgi:hypothetical protein